MCTLKHVFILFFNIGQLLGWEYRYVLTYLSSSEYIVIVRAVRGSGKTVVTVPALSQTLSLSRFHHPVGFYFSICTSLCCFLRPVLGLTRVVLGMVSELWNQQREQESTKMTELGQHLEPAPVIHAALSTVNAPFQSSASPLVDQLLKWLTILDMIFQTDFSD